MAAHSLGMSVTASFLFLINKIAYAVLLVLLILHFFVSAQRPIENIIDHEQGPSLFTVVAGTCILGSQFVELQKNIPVGFVFWVAGAVLWAVLLYSFFISIATKGQNRPLENALDGRWLIFVVGTQSVSVLGTMIAPLFPAYEGILLFAMLSMFLMGGALYIILIVLIMYRLLFFSLSPRQFSPHYWITMGAAAITTLAGTTLIMESAKGGFLADMLLFVKGTCYFFWAVATWWIPFLLAMSVWKYVRKRVPFTYDVEDWSTVFPLGMYALCTHQFATSTELTFLSALPPFFIFIALLSWIVLFIGLIKRIITVLFLPSYEE